MPIENNLNFTSYSSFGTSFSNSDPTRHANLQKACKEGTLTLSNPLEFDINQPINGELLLHTALKHGQLKTALLLTQCHADWSKLDTNFKSAWHYFSEIKESPDRLTLSLCLKEIFPSKNSPSPISPVRIKKSSGDTSVVKTIALVALTVLSVLTLPKIFLAARHQNVLSAAIKRGSCPSIARIEGLHSITGAFNSYLPDSFYIIKTCDFVQNHVTTSSVCGSEEQFSGIKFLKNNCNHVFSGALDAKAFSKAKAYADLMPEEERLNFYGQLLDKLDPEKSTDYNIYYPSITQEEIDVLRELEMSPQLKLKVHHHYWFHLGKNFGLYQIFAYEKKLYFEVIINLLIEFQSQISDNDKHLLNEYLVLIKDFIKSLKEKGKERFLEDAKKLEDLLPNINKKLEEIIATEKNNAFKTLGLAINSSKSEIKDAYKTLSLKFHPDKNRGDPTAEAKFIKIASAYEILTS